MRDDFHVYNAIFWVIRWVVAHYRRRIHAKHFQLAHILNKSWQNGFYIRAVIPNYSKQTYL